MKTSTKVTIRKVKKHWQLYILMILPVAYLILFKYKPLLGIQIAFRDYNFRDGVWGSPWVGWKYFIQFFQTPTLYRLLRNTIVLSFYGIIAGLFPPIILAIALNYVRNKRWGKVVQTVTYLPYFISTVLVVSILTQMLSLTGPINNMIMSLGGEAVLFTGSPGLFRHVYVWSGVWQSIGYNSVIYISALAAVDYEMHEAAIVDGANIWQRIWYIDLPSIKTTIVTLLILSCGHVMTTGYEKVLLLQNDLNMTTSDVIDTYVYRVGLTSMQYSYSTAVGLFQSVVSLILLGIVNTISKKVSDASLW